MKRKLFLLLCALLTMIGVQAQETFTETYDLTGRKSSDWSNMLKKRNAGGKDFDVFVNGTNEHVLVWGGATGSAGLDTGGRDWGATALAFRNVGKGDKVAFTVTEASMLSNLSLYANSDKISYTDEGNTRTFSVNEDGVSIIEFGFTQNSAQVIVTQIQYTYQLPEGFTKVTSADDLTEANFANNYYVITAETNPHLALKYNTTRGGDGHTDLSYDDINVTNNLYQLWTLEAYDGGFSMRNVVRDNLLLQTESYGAYPIRTNDQPNVCSWTKIVPTSDSNEGFTFQWGQKSGNYFGLWTPANDYNSGEYLAGNKTATAQIGHFNIYAIPRVTFHATYAASNSDLTEFLINPAVSNKAGWTGINTNSGQQYTGAPDNTYMDRSNNTANMYQQIKLPAGTYIVKAATRASKTQGTAHLYALKVGASDLDTGTLNKRGNEDNVLGNGWNWTFMGFTLDEETTMQLGFYMNKSSWAGADDFRLYRVDSDNIPDDLVAAIVASKSTESMGADAFASQAEAVTTLQSEKTFANFIALRNAINTANASVAAYENAASVVEKMNALLEGTNFYTTATYNDFYSYITGYENKTLTTSELNNLNTTIFNSTKNAGKAAKLIMSNFEVNGDAVSPAYYANTWSTEGNNDGTGMTTPFIEYYITDGSTLANRDLTATQTGLTPNATYAVRALVRVKKSTGSEAATPSGITMQVGSGSEVDVCAGTNVNTTYWYGTYTASGTTDESGNLMLKFKVEDTSVSWLAVKNIKYLPLDFSALNSAISNTEAVLGFENGEYAPYANIAKMTALANAKNVLNGTTSVSTQDEIDSYTDALNNAAWTAANSGSVNAVYNPTFSLSTDNGAMAGWSTNDGTTLGTAGHSRAFVLTSGMTNYDNLEPFGQGDGTRSCAYLRWDGYNSKQTTRYIYGATAGYTMPLKTDVLYRLTLELGGWGQAGKSIKVAITNEAGTELSSETETTDATGINDGGKNLTSYSFDFRPNTAGNYYLVISNPGSGVNNAIVVSNLSLVSVDEMAEHTAAVTASDITSLLQNADLEAGQTGWNGQTGYISNNEGWRGDVTNKYIERTSTGSFSQTIYNMPAGTYKVVAAARAETGRTITAEIAGSTGTSITGTGNAASAGRNEINTNGIEMPYSSTGGFTTHSTGHNWKWISATGTLNEAGNLVIRFNCSGNAWMAIDDVHLYYVSDAYDGHEATATYCISVPEINANQTIANSGKVVTCDLIASNPNAIISSDEAITGANGQINNNLVSSTVANLVLYDGYEFSADDDFMATNAKLYRSVTSGGFATVCAPFAISSASGTFYEPTKFTNNVLTFGEQGTPGAGKAYLFKASADVTEMTGAGEVTATPVDNGTGVVMKGTYNRIATIDHDNYILSSGTLYKVDSDVSLNPFRAYFSIGGGNAGARITLRFDDTTGINAVEAVETGNNVKDGKYLIDGKIVIVKNGVKYGTNGQKLN